MKVFDINLTKVDYISVTFILVQLFILVLNWSHLPTAELDTPYHLLMGKMFSDYDTVMLWDYYEYAPTGRPHLYPPLEHILLWWMHDITGADWWNIGRFISLIQYPLPLFTVWFFSRKLFNPVTALASLVFLSISQEFWFWQVSVAPTALILSLFPLYLYCFYRKKVFTSIILLSSFLYLHLGLPYVIIFSTFIFSLFSLYKTREYLKQFAVVTGASALIFLPWIIHILMYKDWLSSSPRQVFDPFSLLVGINILTAVFFILGVWKCLREARIDLRYLLVLSTAIGFLAIALYGWRYKMHSPIINCIVGGIGFELLYTKILAKTTPVSRKKVAAIVLLLLIPLGAFSLTLTAKMPSPGQPQQPKTPQQQLLPGQLQQFPGQQPPGQQSPQLPQKPPGQQPLPPNNQNQPPRQPQPLQQQSFLDLLRNPQIRIQPSPLVEMLISLKTGERPPRVWQIDNPEIDELIEWICDNTSSDDILHLSNGMLADYLALFTDRRTDAGMYREVSSSEMFKAIEEGRKSGIFIIEIDQFKEKNPPGLSVLEQFGNLLVMQGIRSEKIPQEIPLHLDELFILLERPEPSLIDRWMRVIQEVNPRTIYIGVRQKDVKTPELQEFIDALTPLRNVKLSVIVEDETIKNMTLPAGITTLRLVIPQDKISFSFIEAVDRSLDPKINLEIAVIGPPFFENKKVYESLLQVLPLVDRVVRHVSPNIESISVTREEQRILGEKFFLQIDTYRGQFEITPEELYTLLQAAARITMNKTIIEFKYPPATFELINFLKKVYAV
jgi:hypothetical protein